MDHGAVDESSSERRIHYSEDHTFIVKISCTHTPSLTGSYGMTASRLKSQNFKKFCKSILNTSMGCFNQSIALITLYQCTNV